MSNAQALATGALLAIATLAALGTPAPRLIATGCNGATATLGIKLAYEESELPTCRNVRRITLSESPQ